MAKELLKKAQQIHQQYDTGIVTAMRGADSPTVERLGIEDVDSWNEKNTDELEKNIVSKGFKYLKLLGSYPEEGGSTVREKSFLIWSESGKDVRMFVVEMGELYDQDSVIYTPKGQKATLIYTNETSGKKGQTEVLGNFTPDSNSEWASEIEAEPGSKFVYESVKVVDIYAKAIKLMRL